MIQSYPISVTLLHNLYCGKSTMSQSFITSLSHQQLLGLSEGHLCHLPEHGDIKVHQAVLSPLSELMSASRRAGFDLRVVSGFRSYHRQLMIWNNKCRGLRHTYDAQGKPLDLSCLSSQQKIYAILRWSALPGASRHHWGSDCDIYDAAAVSASYQLQLQPEEYLGDGPFAPMMHWLHHYLQENNSPDFYRPYCIDHKREANADASNYPQGVAVEPWHISYRPVSTICAQQLSLSLLREQLQSSTAEGGIDEKVTILRCLDDIYMRYIDLADTHDPIER